MPYIGSYFTGTGRVDSATLPMTGIGKLKAIFECLKGGDCRRPENKNLLVASGCFNMILKGFMSKNTRPIIVKSKMLVLK